MPEFKQKLDDVVFEDEPKKFCQIAYEKAQDYNNSLNDKVVEDRAFYDGVDPMLIARASDPRVKRSAAFIHESRTAIDTRLSAIMDRIEEDKELLVRMDLKTEEEPTPEQYKKVEDKEKKLNEQLREGKFISENLIKLFKASELQPLSALKVGSEQTGRWVAKHKSIMQMGRGALQWIWAYTMRRGEMPKMEWTTYEYEANEDRPYSEWLDWDEFLWDTKATSLESCQYVIHRKWVTWNELLHSAKENDYKMDLIERMREGDGDSGTDNETIAEEVDEELNYPGAKEKYMKDGKYLLCEFWVRTYDDQDRPIINIAVMGNNYFLLKNKKTHFPNIDFPFEPRVAWPKLGKMEGISSIELIKPIQRLYNDTHNCILDAASYGIFPVLLQEQGTTFSEEPKLGPGVILKTNNIDGTKPLQLNLGAIDILPPLNDTYAAKIRQVLNAPDVNQGIRDSEAEEKATKTRLRVMGANRRLRPLFKSVEENIINVAWMFIKMNQRNDPSWVMDVELSVPALSGINTPDEEYYKALNLYESALKNPVYQGIVGIFKIRELWLDVMAKARVDDIDSRCPTKEELGEQLSINIQAPPPMPANNPINNNEVKNDLEKVPRGTNSPIIP